MGTEQNLPDNHTNMHSTYWKNYITLHLPSKKPSLSTYGSENISLYLNKDDDDEKEMPAMACVLLNVELQ